MFYKVRTEPIKLQILRVLMTRANPPKNDRTHFSNLQKGYEGEKRFDSYLEELTCDCLILNDLLLEYNNSTFQIDSLLIVANRIYLFEVKNLYGDYIQDADTIYSSTEREIINPLSQLNRSRIYFSQLLQSLGFDIHVSASVVFINPEFFLYQSPLDLPYIFPNQLKRFISKLNDNKLRLQKMHRLLADKLLEQHKTELTYHNLPKYSYDDLRKGITCISCNSFSTVLLGKYVICETCNQKKKASDAVIRSIKEFKLLFPDQKITTTKVFEWCAGIVPRKRILAILKQYFNSMGRNCWVYFE